MKCQACLMLGDVECVQTATIIEDDVIGTEHTSTIKRAYYCPICKARYIIKEKLDVHT